MFILRQKLRFSNDFFCIILTCLIQKWILKNKKKIILMYFPAKSILKSN